MEYSYERKPSIVRHFTSTSIFHGFSMVYPAISHGFWDIVAPIVPACRIRDPLTGAVLRASGKKDSRNEDRDATLARRSWDVVCRGRSSRCFCELFFVGSYFARFVFLFFWFLFVSPRDEVKEFRHYERFILSSSIRML